MHRVSLCRGVAGNYRLFNRLNADYLRQKAAILRGSGCQASRRVREQAQKKRLSRRCLLLRTSTQPRRSHEELSCYVLYGFRSPGHGPSAVRFVDTGYTLQPTPAGSVSFRVANCFAFRSFICSTRKKCVSRQAPHHRILQYYTPIAQPMFVKLCQKHAFLRWFCWRPLQAGSAGGLQIGQGLASGGGVSTMAGIGFLKHWSRVAGID